MVAQRRGVVARIVRCDDNVTLGGKEGRENEPLAAGVRTRQLRHVVVLYRRGTVGVLDDGTLTLTAGARSARHQERTSRRSRLGLRPRRLVTQLVDVHGTERRVGERQ